MAIQLKVISRDTLTKLNDALGKLNILYDEVCKAQSAGVPELDGVKQQCQDMADRIAKFKDVYFTQQV